MAYGSNPRQQFSYGTVDDANRRRFQRALGLSIEAPDEPSLRDYRAEVEPESSDDLAEMGRAIKRDLSEPLDAEFIEDALSEIADQFGRFPEVLEMGTPEYGQTPYREMAAAARPLVDHLEEAGFFVSAEENLPSFTTDHIEATTRRLLGMDDLTETLSELGLTEEEQEALVTNIVNSSEQLSWWQSSREYPTVAEEGDYEDGVDQEFVPPLHQRAMEGSLLWMDGLDWWLWQNEVLITDEMIECGVWDVKSMLAGLYLLGDAALGVAEGTISDGDLTTVVTASSAIMIIGQEFLVDDVAWITDEDRKPREHDEA